MPPRHTTPGNGKRPATRKKAPAKRDAYVTASAQDFHAWEMIRAGASYREVVDLLGLSHPQTAHRMVQRAGLPVPEPNRAQVKRMLSDQVDDLYRAIRPLAAGRVRRVDTRGRPVDRKSTRLNSSHLG